MNSTEIIERESALEPIAESSAPAKKGRKNVVAKVVLGCFLALSSISLVWAGAHVYRVHRSADWLATLGARVQWGYEHFDPMHMQWSRMKSSLAQTIGPAYVSNITSVEISHGDLGDHELKPIRSLTAVETLRLRSNEASNDSLATIAKLPRLNRLILAGKQFSLTGLLKLRSSGTLRFLALCEMELNDRELALLESTIPNVDIVYYGHCESPVYRRRPAHRLASTGLPVDVTVQSEPAASALFGTSTSAMHAIEVSTVEMQIEAPI